MTSADTRRVRVDAMLPPVLAEALREYGRTWQVPLSVVVELACASYLRERASRADGSPIQVRLRRRRGPLSVVERRLSEEAVVELQARGGRRL